jgi:hypothetical protein
MQGLGEWQRKGKGMIKGSVRLLDLWFVGRDLKNEIADVR